MSDYTDRMADPEALFGFPEEWQSFRERNDKFTECFPRLLETMRRVFDRSVESGEPIDRFVILYGRMCMEEFYEILLMCGNGYGIGAQKILRGLWEKAVTLEHLVNHPDQLNDFFDYHHVSDYKLFSSVRDIIGSDALPLAIIEQNAADYESVKGRFTITDCKKCGTTRVNHTWNKLDIVSMSKHTRMLGKLVNEAYYIPMRHTHSTASSFVMRLEESVPGGLGFNPDPQRKAADSTLRTAQLIILEILDIQQKFYSLADLQPMIEECEQDWIEIYRRKPPESGN